MNAVKELAEQLQTALNKLEESNRILEQYRTRCEELYHENEKHKELIKRFDILLNKSMLVESE